MDVLPLLMLVAGSAAIAGLARRTPVPAPLLLVAAGLAVSYLPGVPAYELDPHIVLPLILPPLLYTAGVESSYLDLRANWRPVLLLSVGYVLFATLAVGYAVHLIVPDLPLTAALVSGGARWIMPARGGLARTSAALSSLADAPRRLPPPPCSCTHQTTAHVAVQGRLSPKPA